MMISPEQFAEMHKGKWQGELVKIREDLINQIHAFENDEYKESEWNVDPSPAVVYEMNHLYLAEISKLIFDSFDMSGCPVLGPELSGWNE
ncbi:MAG: hypothetical protein MR773_01870 [Eubacterium coprostanoligenes]|nr:hypothetical protein [Eubacterium coprostanoligenes]